MTPMTMLLRKQRSVRKHQATDQSVGHYQALWGLTSGTSRPLKSDGGHGRLTSPTASRNHVPHPLQTQCLFKTNRDLVPVLLLSLTSGFESRLKHQNIEKHRNTLCERRAARDLFRGLRFDDAPCPRVEGFHGPCVARIHDGGVLHMSSTCRRPRRRRLRPSSPVKKDTQLRLSGTKAQGVMLEKCGPPSASVSFI